MYGLSFGHLFKRNSSAYRFEVTYSLLSIGAFSAEKNTKGFFGPFFSTVNESSRAIIIAAFLFITWKDLFG